MLRKTVFALLMGALLACTAKAQSAPDLYKSRCAACHGADGKGDTAVGKKIGVRDFHSDEVQKQSDAQLAEIVKDGKNKMPAYKDKLKDDQISDLIKYVRQLGK